MAEISIGKLKLSSDARQLLIDSEDGFDGPVTLDAKEVGELIVFLVSLSATEFNQRQAFRIPLWRSINLKVWLIIDAKKIEVAAINLSMTGMLIELPDELDVPLKVSRSVNVLVDYEGIETRLAGKISWVEGLKLGLEFPQASTASKIDPYPEYSGIVMSIQRSWAARVKGD